MAAAHQNPYSPTGAAGYEYRAVVLGGPPGVAAQIAELARAGWELVRLSAPHYGALTIIGEFRRATDPPGAGR